MRRLFVPLALAAAVVVGTVLVASRTQGPRADLVWTAGQEVADLDPAKMTSLQDGRVASALFEGLTVVDPRTLKVRPGVARWWEVSEDRLTYTFHLRDDARWSDGRPVTAEDFEYSWRRVLDPSLAAEYVYMLYPIRGARAHYETSLNDPAGEATASTIGVRMEGPHTLLVTLERPCAYFLDLTAFSTYLPVRRDVVEKHGSRWTLPPWIVSNGAYRLVEWRFQSRMVWERNEHYWDAPSVALGRIELRVFDTVNTPLLAYETGAVDLTTIVPSLAIQPLLEGRDAGRRTDVMYGPNLGTYFYRFNCSKPPFADVRLRRALALAVNRRDIIQRAARGGQLPATVLVPPGLPGYVPPPGLTEDLDEARRLLAEAGHPGGAGLDELVLLVNKSADHVPVAELIQQQWAAGLGVRVRIEQVEWKVFLDRIRTLDYQVARAGWYGDYVDPNTFLDMFVTGGGNNQTGWSNRQYDALVEAAARETGGAARMQTFAKAEKILLDEVPIVPLYVYTTTMLVRPGLEGVNSNLMNRIDFALLRWNGRPTGEGGTHP